MRKNRQYLRACVLGAVISGFAVTSIGITAGPSGIAQTELSEIQNYTQYEMRELVRISSAEDLDNLAADVRDLVKTTLSIEEGQSFQEYKQQVELSGDRENTELLVYFSPDADREALLAQLPYGSFEVLYNSTESAYLHLRSSKSNLEILKNSPGIVEVSENISIAAAPSPVPSYAKEEIVFYTAPSTSDSEIHTKEAGYNDGLKVFSEGADGIVITIELRPDAYNGKDDYHKLIAFSESLVSDNGYYDGLPSLISNDPFRFTFVSTQEIFDQIFDHEEVTNILPTE